MNIGLVDVDGHNFPNLALMKLSAYHKGRGDTVDWANGFEHYDRLYMAKVFDETYTQDDNNVYQADEIIRGGTGYDLTSKLPDDVEHIYPDYGLYGITDMAYGYLTRGCPRGCKFCIVGRKEGLQSRKVADLSEFWSGQKYIKLLDPNITACPDFEELISQLADSRAKVDFTQGLDIRLMTKEKAESISRVRVKLMHFAWDNPIDDSAYKKLLEMRPYFRQNERNLGAYILTNFNSTFEQDIDRIYKVRDAGYTPYVMIYDKYHAPRKVRLLARWCNNRRVFRKVRRFEDFECSLA